jgi:hypothetical protein
MIKKPDIRYWASLFKRVANKRKHNVFHDFRAFRLRSKSYLKIIKASINMGSRCMCR